MTAGPSRAPTSGESEAQTQAPSERVAAARKAQLAADAALARAIAEDETGSALDDGRHNVSSMGLTNKGDVVTDMQEQVLANAASKRATENQAQGQERGQHQEQDRILSQEGHAKKRGRRTRSVRIG